MFTLNTTTRPPLSPVARYSPVGPNSTAERTSAGEERGERREEEGEEERGRERRGGERRGERRGWRERYLFFCRCSNSGGKELCSKKKKIGERDDDGMGEREGRDVQSCTTSS